MCMRDFFLQALAGDVVSAGRDVRCRGFQDVRELLLVDFLVVLRTRVFYDICTA